jgi:peptide/nickel transport system permease protein
MIPVVLGVTILVFTIMYFIPGDPVMMMLGPEATAAEIAALRQELGLNDPYLVRLGKFLGGIVLHFDFGDSWVYNTPVTTELLHRLPRTAAIAAGCIALQIFVGIPLGVIAAVNHNGWGDRIAMFTALFGISDAWILVCLDAYPPFLGNLAGCLHGIGG